MKDEGCLRPALHWFLAPVANHIARTPPIDGTSQECCELWCINSVSRAQVPALEPKAVRFNSLTGLVCPDPDVPILTHSQSKSR